MTGVCTGAYALHPLSGERVPIWVADYVLEGHGTDAIMGVPAHDGADLAFARAMDLPVRIVVQSVVGDMTSVEEGVAFTRPGVLVDSGPYSGLTSQEARAAIIGEFEARGIGKRAIKYRLRDWLISRQRYWAGCLSHLWRTIQARDRRERQFPGLRLVLPALSLLRR